MMKETANMKDRNETATTLTQLRLAKRSPEYWRVTFDHPPLNIFGPEMLPQVNVMTAIETDEQVKVVVFDSAVEGFFLIHLDFLANLDNLVHLPPGPTVALQCAIICATSIFPHCRCEDGFNCSMRVITSSTVPGSNKN
jgi:hypothetical protein